MVSDNSLSLFGRDIVVLVRQRQLDCSCRGFRVLTHSYGVYPENTGRQSQPTRPGGGYVGLDLGKMRLVAYRLLEVGVLVLPIMTDIAYNHNQTSRMKWNLIHIIFPPKSHLCHRI